MSIGYDTVLDQEAKKKVCSFFPLAQKRNDQTFQKTQRRKCKDIGRATDGNR
jgi:hypothetical protein